MLLWFLRRFLQFGSLLAVVVVAISVTLTAMACDDGALATLESYGKAIYAKVMPDRPAVTGKENFVGLGDYAGECEQPDQNNLRGKKIDTYHLEAKPDAEAAFDRYTQNHPGQPWRRYDGQPLDSTDFVAIDAMARTLMGEMGNESSCGKPYMAGAARVIMNRGIELLNNPKKYSRMFGSGKRCTDFSQCVANAALMSKQFSVWNHLPFDKNKSEAMARSKNPKLHAKGEAQLGADDSQEGVTHTALCPRGGDGVHVIPAQLQAWRDAVEIATTAVTAPWKMKDITPDIHALWYTSAMAMCGGTHLPDGHAYGQLLGKDSCIELWNDNGKCERHKEKPKAKAAPSKPKVKTPARKAKVVAPPKAKAAKSKAKAPEKKKKNE